MDIILPLFDPPPSWVDRFYTLSMDKNIYFLTPSPTHLVHVLIEWPLMRHQRLGKSVRPKFGIGAKFRPKLWVSVSVSEPKFFFSEAETFFFQNFSKFFIFFMYSLIQYKGYNFKLKSFDGAQFRKYFISLPAFYLITWLVKSPKNFEKTSFLKIWWLVFFRGVKTHFGEILLKSYIFRHDKNWFSPILPHNIYFSH